MEFLAHLGKIFGGQRKYFPKNPHGLGNLTLLGCDFFWALDQNSCVGPTTPTGGFLYVPEKRVVALRFHFLARVFRHPPKKIF